MLAKLLIIFFIFISSSIYSQIKEGKFKIYGIDTWEFDSTNFIRMDLPNKRDPVYVDTTNKAFKQIQYIPYSGYVFFYKEPESYEIGYKEYYKAYIKINSLFGEPDIDLCKDGTGKDYIYDDPILVKRWIWKIGQLPTSKFKYEIELRYDRRYFYIAVVYK